MGRMDDPFAAWASDEQAAPVAVTARASGTASAAGSVPLASVVTGRLQGFDLDDHPLICGLPLSAGLAITARTTVDLRRSMIGQSVVVAFEQGDAAWPIVIGVLQAPAPSPAALAQSSSRPLSVYADDQRFVVSAEREIVLRCGDASITLTRAGKVIIKGNYVLSRSTGYNKIKGAAVDIN